jgi:hypothetical protein
VACIAWAGTACIPDKHKEPEWQKPPQSWNPKTDEMTFGAKNLEAFNAMSASEREAHLQALKDKAGAVKGQAQFQRALEIGENVSEAQYGKHEVHATIPEPVLYEITVEYFLYANDPIGQGFAPGTYTEFTGTLADAVFADDAKPRKLEIRLKDVTLNRLQG